MQSAMDPGTIEAQIREWRSYLLRRRTITTWMSTNSRTICAAEIPELGAAGLSGDESFLVQSSVWAPSNELSREFARERSSQPVEAARARWRHRPRTFGATFGLLITLGFAIAAAVAFKVPAAFGINPFVTELAIAPMSTPRVVLPAQRRAAGPALADWLLAGGAVSRYV